MRGEGTPVWAYPPGSKVPKVQKSDGIDGSDLVTRPSPLVPRYFARRRQTRRPAAIAPKTGQRSRQRGVERQRRGASARQRRGGCHNGRRLGRSSSRLRGRRRAAQPGPVRSPPGGWFRGRRRRGLRRRGRLRDRRRQRRGPGVGDHAAGDPRAAVAARVRHLVVGHRVDHHGGAALLEYVAGRRP